MGVVNFKEDLKKECPAVHLQAKADCVKKPFPKEAYSHPNPTTKYFLNHPPHILPDTIGINPLVDAAAYLFSYMGKIKNCQECSDLGALQAELVKEIDTFEQTLEKIHTQPEYFSEYLPISIYALCMTIDDLIFATSWGRGKWDLYSLVVYFNHDSLSSESFLIILERLVRDPNIYIEIMEFLYICLRLGFNCRQATEFGYEQIEQITNSLYQRIRIYRGNYSKNLSPYNMHSKVHTQNKSAMSLIRSLFSIRFIR